ncbi:hypothetical protein [Microbacterium sp.]|uniref:hypothetical protein n=1 Tax=Microbacterium sp. TaxID=51671 RepID=UPI0039E4C7AF
MTAVDVKIGDAWYYSLSDWSVESSCTPLVAGDTTGGVGAVSFTLPEAAKSKRLQGDPCLLVDPHMGTMAGELRLAGGNGVNTTITGYSKIAALNVNRTAEAYTGTLRGAILYYLGLCGVTQRIAVQASLATRSVRYIGWQGNVLDKLKDLCAAQQMELTQVGQFYVFREPGSRIVFARSFDDWTWQASEDQLAQNVEVAWYDTSQPTSQIVYPAGGWTADVPVFQVGAGEIATYEIDMMPQEDAAKPIGMSVLSIDQPSCVASVARQYSGTASVYAVAGKDGLPIQPAQWTAGGGDLKVEILEAGLKLKVTITGSSETEYAPYQIAMTSGTSDAYSSLRLYGNAMRFKRGVLTMQTGLDGDRAPQETTPIIDNPFLNSYDAAHRAAVGVLSKHSSATYTINGTVTQVEAGPENVITFFGSEDISNDPAAHPFGNLEGSFFFAEGMVFRIRSVTYTPGGARFTAEQHHTGLMDSALLSYATGTSSRTATAWNAAYPAGLTADDFNADPTNGFSL